MRVRSLSLGILMVACFGGSAVAQNLRSRLKGLVFEAEAWSTPGDAWVKDKHPGDKWCLWTQEQDVHKKRSGGQSFQSPHIKTDRATPEEGAPPLHTHITGLPQGLFRVWMNNPSRTIALSFDGKEWEPRLGRGELNLGVHLITDGTFDLWVDDRYAFPDRLGWCYYDYLRFERFEAPAFSDLTAFTLPDGRTQISWITDRPFDTGTVHYGEGNALDQTMPGGGIGLRNHAVVLPPGVPNRPHSAQVRVAYRGREVARSDRQTFVPGTRPVPKPTTSQTILLSVAEPTSHPRAGWPVTSGIPFAQGMLASADDVHLLDPSGSVLPAQFEMLAAWPDGSVRWLLVDFRTATIPGRPSEYRLVTGPVRQRAGMGDDIIRAAETGFVLEPGPFQIRIDRESSGLVGHLMTTEGRRVDLGSGELVSDDGSVYRPGPPERIVVETNGPLRGTLRVEGRYVSADGLALMRYRARLTVYRGRPDVRVQWTIGNDSLAETFVELSRVSLRIPLPGTKTATLASGAGGDISETVSLAMLQDYDDHVAVTHAGQTEERERDSGFVRVRADGLTLDAMVRDFWQTYPKGIRVTPDGLTLDLLPALPEDQFAAPQDRTDERQIALFYCYRNGKYLFKRGMEYTADLMLSVGEAASPSASERAAHWQSPLQAVAPSSHYCGSGAFWWVDAHRPPEFSRYFEAFETSFANLEKGRVSRGEYGWMNYGDWWGERSWNWGNSEYDLQYVCAVNFAQTGNLDVFRRGDQMARHNTTVDTVHYPWQPGMRELVYAHSVGHVGGFFERNDGRITNKVYSMTGFIRGARDGSGGHTFQGGNFLYGFLTGDRRYLEVAENVCWNQAETYTPNWRFGIERSCGWSLYNAMSAFESTLNPYYLNAARIYLEKVYELQDPETGGWRMRQGAPECDCPDAPHVGGKAFATGVLLHGLMMVDRAVPDAKVKASLVRGVDWLIDHSWNESKNGFRYKTGCAKFANHGWYTTLVTGGIAYAYEITKDARYRDFLLRTLPRPAGKTTGSGRSSGKSFASNFRKLPHALYFVKRWGIASLVAPPARPTIHLRDRVFLTEEGAGSLVAYVTNPRKTVVPCEVRVISVSDGVTVEPRTLTWSGNTGTGASPGVQIRASTDAGSMRVVCRAGNATCESVVALVRVRPLQRTGSTLGFVGPAGHFSLTALQAAGGDVVRIESLQTWDPSAFRAVVVGADVLGRLRSELDATAGKLAAFVNGGGRVVFLQINDADWRLGMLPFDVIADDRNGTLATFADAADWLTDGLDPLRLTGAVCFDTLTAVGPECEVLAHDATGGPCLVRARYGAGEFLIIEPSFDRWEDGGNSETGVSEMQGKRFLANLLAYLSRG